MCEVNAHDTRTSQCMNERFGSFELQFYVDVTCKIIFQIKNTGEMMEIGDEENHHLCIV